MRAVLDRAPAATAEASIRVALDQPPAHLANAQAVAPAEAIPTLPGRKPEAADPGLPAAALSPAPDALE